MLSLTAPRPKPGLSGAARVRSPPLRLDIVQSLWSLFYKSYLSFSSLLLARAYDYGTPFEFGMPGGHTLRGVCSRVTSACYTGALLHHQCTPARHTCAMFTVRLVMPRCRATATFCFSFSFLPRTRPLGEFPPSRSSSVYLKSSEPLCVLTTPRT